MAEYRVARLGELAPGSIKEVMVDGERVALYNVEGTVYASANRCPHAGAPLSRGFLEGDEITCPLHMWGFNVRTGECLTDPDYQGLRRYEVRIDGDEIVIVVPDTSLAESAEG